MTETLTPYPEYRASDLPWLREIPAHWRLVRAKQLFTERVEKGHPNAPLLAATQTQGVVLKEKYGSRTVTAFKDLHLLKLVEPGDFVISLRSFEGGIELAHDRGIISPAYTVLKPNAEARTGYFAHFFKSATFIDSLSLYVTGIREGQNIDYNRLSRFELPVPPPDEQDAIARFLGATVNRTNRLIRAKQRLIALLTEQKQAVIQRAVTRGLDPDVPLKPSGVDWLGDVPAHWDVQRLRYLSDIRTGGSDTADRVEDGDYPFYVRSQHVERINTYSFDGEAVLTAGDGAGVAKVFHYVTGKFDFHQRVYKFSNFRSITGKFAYYYISACLKYEVLRLSAKSTVDSLRLPMLQNFSVAFPAHEEQVYIVREVEQRTSKLDEAIEKARAEIALIKEYRARLVADVVTGKLDVRGVSVPDVPSEALVEPVEALGEEEIADDA